MNRFFKCCFQPSPEVFINDDERWYFWQNSLNELRPLSIDDVEFVKPYTSYLISADQEDAFHTYITYKNLNNIIQNKVISHKKPKI